MKVAAAAVVAVGTKKKDRGGHLRLPKLFSTCHHRRRRHSSTTFVRRKQTQQLEEDQFVVSVFPAVVYRCWCFCCCCCCCCCGCYCSTSPRHPVIPATWNNTRSGPIRSPHWGGVRHGEANSAQLDSHSGRNFVFNETSVFFQFLFLSLPTGLFTTTEPKIRGHFCCPHCSLFGFHWVGSFPNKNTQIGKDFRDHKNETNFFNFLWNQISSIET